MCHHSANIIVISKGVLSSQLADCQVCFCLLVVLEVVEREGDGCVFGCFRKKLLRSGSAENAVSGVP